MEKKKKDVYKVKPLTEGKKNIIASLLQEYDIQSAQDIQVALRDLLGGTIQSMLEAEMEEHLGYENYERTEDRMEGDNYRNGTKKKKIRSQYGEFEVEVPQDRNSSFDPKIVKKRQKDISEIDQKIINMYARGLTTRQISQQIEELYGFECSESFISNVTDKILQDNQYTNKIAIFSFFYIKQKQENKERSFSMLFLFLSCFLKNISTQSYLFCNCSPV